MIQVTALTLCGIKACYVSGSVFNNQQCDAEFDEEAVVKGNYQVVYFTPEMLLGSRKWRTMLLGEVYTRHLQALIIDEAHTVIQW